MDAETALVVEGYQGSANSFLQLALEACNPGIRIASHMHSPAHVQRALQLDVPVVVVVREPVASITSMLRRFPVLDVAAALRRYAVFHERLARHLEDVLIVRFEDLTSDGFGDVVRRINDRFGTTFASGDVSPIAEAFERQRAAATDDGDTRTRITTELAAARHARRLARARRARDALLAAALTKRP